MNRRSFIRCAGLFGTAILLGGCFPEVKELEEIDFDLERAQSAGLPGPDQLTPLRKVTAYNNFYEFGTGKEDPASFAHSLVTEPWTVSVEGHCENPGVLDLDQLLEAQTVEERIYRMRCVEGWSMVIPWQGVSLGKVLERFKPLPQAAFVAFETLFDPEMMVGQRYPHLPWPYLEGLRMDEAMHPLTLLATGLYGKDLPNQNGAPLRLVVPWKYGFKGIKSIVAIRFVEKMPPATWANYVPSEYGFFANVNPEVSHPRWSQRMERRLGEIKRRRTLPFNGYGEEVSSLYTGMDLKKWF